MNIRSKFITVLVILAVAGFVALPSSWKTSFEPFFGPLATAEISKGLDLAGGVGLDFKVDTSDVPEERLTQVLDGIRGVLMKRVNSLGVSEPNIVLSQVGNEQHINVTIAGVTDIKEAKDTIGKTIQLEFKVPKDALDTEEASEIEADANRGLAELRTAENFEERALALVEEKSDARFFDEKTQFEDEIGPDLAGKIKTLGEGRVLNELVETSMSFLKNGALFAKRGYTVTKLVAKEDKLRTIPKSAEDFQAVANEINESPSIFTDVIKPGSSFAEDPKLSEAMKTMTEGEVSDVIESERGIYVLKMTDSYAAGSEVVAADHILFTTANTAPLSSIPANASEEERTRIEAENAEISASNKEIENGNVIAEASAKDIREKVLSNPDSFNDLAAEFSEDPSAATNRGDLGLFPKGYMFKEFEEAAWALEKGAISEVVKTPAGYHVIRKQDHKPANEAWVEFEQILVCYEGASHDSCNGSTRTKQEALAIADEAMKRVRTETSYTYQVMMYSTDFDPWKPAEFDGKQLTGEYFERADVTFDHGRVGPVVTINFNQEGGKLFENLTEEYLGKQIGIFVGGQLISAPMVNQRIAGGQAQITGTFTVKDASDLARDLNTGAIPAPIVLVGEEVVGPELGADALSKSIMAGAVGLLLLALYLIAFYRTSGVIAVIALALYATIFFALIKLLPGFNLTLSSVAAIILSIGMAVDGNVLIFERFKEERENHEKLLPAVLRAFDRAWPAIRDSQFSSLITAFLLFLIGSDAVRGFAVFLIIGIVLSLFSAVWVTRVLMIQFVQSGMYGRK